jgi:hypothetical protein
MVWIAAGTSSAPVPNQIRSTFVGKTKEISTATIDSYGTPGARLSLESVELIFNCEMRRINDLILLNSLQIGVLFP